MSIKKKFDAETKNHGEKTSKRYFVFNLPNDVKVNSLTPTPSQTLIDDS